VIAAYLLPGDEPALVDCGPTSCLGALEAALGEHGLRLEDLRHLVLTHIHLDHAGAAGVMVRANPTLRIHVSEIGAPHLVDPSRLERSARRLYENFDELWGELAPVPEGAIEVVGNKVLDLEASRPRPTSTWRPGNARLNRSSRARRTGFAFLISASSRIRTAT
jgi:glyoxylase-like metal-dependent hydrolase (beta-lactamase superfamily II)